MREDEAILTSIIDITFYNRNKLCLFESQIKKYNYNLSDYSIYRLII